MKVNLFSLNKKLILAYCGGLLLILASGAGTQARAQATAALPDSVQPPVNLKRLRLLTVGGSTTYALSLLALNQLWYANNPRTSFHFFNDNDQWLQMDKAGHLYTTFQLSRTGSRAFRWTGMPARKAAVLGSLTGLILMTPIEILDGFSSSYGASWGDAAANLSGSALFLGQHLLWDDTRITPKFSFQRSGLASLRPNTLGKGLQEEFLKDYNGQTYWLSLNVQSFLPKQKNFPRWLNIAVGYGGQQMIYAREEENRAQGFTAYRQFYLSLDLAPSRIRTHSKVVKTLLFALDAIKIPAPTLEWNPQQGWRFHPVYF